MNISDLLKEHAPEFDRKLTRIMENTAGNAVLRELNETFPDAEDARDWYFSNIHSLGSKRPYDCCVEGKQGQVVKCIGKNKIWLLLALFIFCKPSQFS